MPARSAAVQDTEIVEDAREPAVALAALVEGTDGNGLMDSRDRSTQAAAARAAAVEGTERVTSARETPSPAPAAAGRPSAVDTAKGKRVNGTRDNSPAAPAAPVPAAEGNGVKDTRDRYTKTADERRQLFSKTAK